MISKKVEKKIINSIDIIFLLDELGIEYIKSGTEIRMVCPFHTGANGYNFSINTSKKVFQCFSHHCEQNGYNLTDFVMKRRGFSDRDEAIKYMARLFDFEIDERSCNVQPCKFNEQKGLCFKESTIDFRRMLKSLKATDVKATLKRTDLKEYHSCLNNKAVQNYLTSRGITDDDMEDFYLGFDPKAEEIVFPVYNSLGDLISVARRSIYDVEGYDSKYKFFGKKSECLYGYYELINKGSDLSNIILVEGVFDTIALQRGYEFNALGLMGCQMSNYQLKILTEIAPTEITICLDNDSKVSEDNPGRKGTFSCINKLTEAGFDMDKISVIELKDYQDPDEVPENNFKRYYDQRIRAMDFYLKYQIR